ncbi:MAG: hypothetical protein M1135_03820 [Candidatus Omnitrophica bacterium]|jgi:hypothetical protein|nr:hypothetical protein [Candidatus Omnitrophota bacterium]
MSLLLKDKKFLLLIFLPAILQAIFPKLWIDPFLIALFYISWENTDKTIFSSFILIIIWSIIKYYIIGENIGIEMLSLIFVWYYLNYFNFKISRISKIINIIIGNFIFVFITIFIPNIKGLWSVPMFFKFFIYFTCINLIFCWIIWNLKNFIKTYI